MSVETTACTQPEHNAMGRGGAPPLPCTLPVHPTHTQHAVAITSFGRTAQQTTTPSGSRDRAQNGGIRHGRQRQSRDFLVVASRPTPAEPIRHRDSHDCAIRPLCCDRAQCCMSPRSEKEPPRPRNAPQTAEKRPDPRNNGVGHVDRRNTDTGARRSTGRKKSQPSCMRSRNSAGGGTGRN